MNGELLAIAIVSLAVAAIPIVVAVVRGHAYTGIIAVLVVVSCIAALITGPGGLIVWVAAMIWACWPKRTGFASPLVDSTSSAVGATLGGHERDRMEIARPEELLLKLRDLRDAGLLSDDEFERRAAVLRSRIIGALQP